MTIRKLHTVDSTNSYLKDWARKELLENFTTVVTQEQTQGRGQRGNYWHSEKGKNLTFSILIRISDFKASKQFELNQAISLGVLQALKRSIPENIIEKPNLQVKWPNDIMAGDKKIAGILIENTLKQQHIKHSIVGIGLNVNQTHFPSALPYASSLKNLTHKDYELDVLLEKIVRSIKKQCTKLESQESLESEYLNNLYRFGIEASYKDTHNQEFDGSIIGLTPEGKLRMELSNPSLKNTPKIKEFGFKEITFL